jgi:hypothetical protein
LSLSARARVSELRPVRVGSYSVFAEEADFRFSAFSMISLLWAG